MFENDFLDTIEIMIGNGCFFDKPEIVPNCVLCKWIISEKNAFNILYHECSAQGYGNSEKVYGSKNCKLLYDEKAKNNGVTKK